MTQVSDLVAFLKAFSQLHRLTGIAVHPTHAGTMAGLLDACEKEVIALEAAQKPAPSQPVTSAEANVIHVKFTRPTPPEGGAA